MPTQLIHPTVLFRRPILVAASISWSKCWNERHPWSRDGVALPYFGQHVRVWPELNRKLRTINIGPLAIQIGTEKEEVQG